MGCGISQVLCALYVPGLRRPFEVPRRRWRQVDSVVRAHGIDRLSDNGLWQEALVLATPGVLEEAGLLLAGVSVITAACPSYPIQWLSTLQDGAPPALWCSGAVPGGPFLGVVGSRQPSQDALRFAKAVAGEARRLGFSVVSGGAQGCDRASRPDLEIVPYGPRRCGAGVLRCCGEMEARKRGGLKAREPETDEAWAPPSKLSLARPDEEFSTALAMERNGLIYSLSEATVVVEARFKQGGSWIGAVDALRRRRCRVIVRTDSTNPAMKALIALGGIPLADPSGLAEALRATEGQSCLFPPPAPVAAGTISA